MDGGHAELLGDREVRRGVVGENALARRDPEFVSGDQVNGGVRLARSDVARDDHCVEDAVQVVARVRIVLAVAPRIRQQADSDASFAGALDQAQDLGAGAQAGERAGQQAAVIDPEKAADRQFELALGDLGRLHVLEGLPAFPVVVQDAGERAGVEALPDAERGQLREQVRGDNAAEIEDEALITHAVQLRRRRRKRACLRLPGAVYFLLRVA